MMQFILKYLWPKWPARKVDPLSENEQFRESIRERAVAAFVRGALALPLYVEKPNAGDELFKRRVIALGRGFHILDAELLPAGTLLRESLYQIAKEFEIGLTDQAAAVIDAVLQDEVLEGVIAKTLRQFHTSLGDDMKAMSMDELREAAQQPLKSRLTASVSKHLIEHGLIVAHLARNEGVKLNVPDVKNLLDKDLVDKPVFEYIYVSTSNRYKPH